MLGRLLLELPSLLPPSSISKGPFEDTGPTWPDNPGPSPHLRIFNVITSAGSLVSCQVAGIPYGHLWRPLDSYHAAPSLSPISGEETAGIFSASRPPSWGTPSPQPKHPVEKGSPIPGADKCSHPNPRVGWQTVSLSGLGQSALAPVRPQVQSSALKKKRHRCQNWSSQTSFYCLQLPCSRA